MQILHEDVPYGNDVANRACQDEEMEYGVHESLAKTIKDSARDVAHALSNDPNDCNRANRVKQRLECHQYRQPHQAEADGLKVTMVFQSDE